jgi:hypothetical protein
MAVAFFIVIGVLTLTRSGTDLAAVMLRVAVVVTGLGAAWLLLDQGASRERSAERRALDQRIATLASRAVEPGSPLACLDAVAGDAVETACEKSVFANPQTVAGAVSYVAARLTLLADALDFARRNGGGYESALTSLRRALEADRYGIVAHVLSVRDSCTPLLCDSYVLLHDPDRVQTNLREHVFDHYVERYASEWARAQAGTPVAAAPAGGAANVYATASTTPPAATAPGVPLSSKYDFPSAASIPPVSIMTSEPPLPPETKPATAAPPAGASATTPTPVPRRPPHAAQHPPARAATAAPQQITPSPPPSPSTAAH